MKLGTKGLYAIPHGKIFSVLKLAIRGLRYLRLKVKNLAFWPFWGILGYFGLTKLVKAPTKHVQVSLGVLELMPETFAHRRCMRSAFRCVP